MLFAIALSIVIKVSRPNWFLARDVRGTYRSIAFCKSGIPRLSTKAVGLKLFATRCATSMMDRLSSLPTLYGRHDLPRKRIVHSQMTRSAAYRYERCGVPLPL